MGNKKPRPTVQVTVKLSPEVAEKLYEVINEEFEGNISEALREAIKLLISSREPKKLEVCQFILEDLGILEPEQSADEKAGTELIVRLKETERAMQQQNQEKL